ncbi:hypothetical protein ACHWQZ_G016384 [Mnemiopsis leidyi]
MKRTVIRRVDCTSNKRSCKTTYSNGQTNGQRDRPTSGKSFQDDTAEFRRRESSRRIFIGKKPADFSSGSSSTFIPTITAKRTNVLSYKHTDKPTNKRTKKTQRAPQTVSLNPLTTKNVQKAQFDSTSLDKEPGTTSEKNTSAACKSRDTTRDTTRDMTRDMARDMTRDSHRKLPGWLRKQWAFSKKLMYNLEIRNMQGLDRLIRSNHDQLREAKRVVAERWICNGDRQTDKLKYRQTDRQTNRQVGARTDDRQADCDSFIEKIKYFDETFSLLDS